MKRSIVLGLVILAALAVPAAAGARGKPFLTVARAQAAIRHADPHAVIGACSRESRVSVRCSLSELAIYVGIEVESDPGAEWHSWATATLRHHHMAVAWA